jgi:hypothetical protein
MSAPSFPGVVIWRNLVALFIEKAGQSECVAFLNIRRRPRRPTTIDCVGADGIELMGINLERRNIKLRAARDHGILWSDLAGSKLAVVFIGPVRRTNLGLPSVRCRPNGASDRTVGLRGWYDDQIVPQGC